MERLLNAVSAMAHQVSPEKVQSIASKIRETTPDLAAAALSGVVGTSAASGMLNELVESWRLANVSAEELAAMLLASSHTVRQAAAEQSIELVWTGPTTPFMSARRTEQALLQVINAAQHKLFITSFVVYDVSGIVKALNLAIDRGVNVSMLLELSQDQGGNVSIDGIGKMRSVVPQAQVYVWREKAVPFSDGSVHAKVAVADGTICFITSANLTGYAMEKNMEAGVLISGGNVPRQLSEHLQSMVDTRILQSSSYEPLVR
jgi:phosphatidylserine/phosphatidylglycerophosphate/cardiolipin synthase-like enzyme